VSARGDLYGPRFRAAASRAYLTMAAWLQRRDERVAEPGRQRTGLTQRRASVYRPSKGRTNLNGRFQRQGVMSDPRGTGDGRKKRPFWNPKSPPPSPHHNHARPGIEPPRPARWPFNFEASGPYCGVRPPMLLLTASNLCPPEGGKLEEPRSS